MSIIDILGNFPAEQGIFPYIEKSTAYLPAVKNNQHDLYQDLAMKLATFLFRCRLTAPASFPAYKGSMLRGTLGTFLKKTCCTMHQPSCDGCMLLEHCAFPLLFVGRSKNRGDKPLTFYRHTALSQTTLAKRHMKREKFFICIDSVLLNLAASLGIFPELAA